MLGLNLGVARIAWTVFALALLLLLLYYIRQTIFLFIGALLLAYLLSPLVNVTDRLLPRKVPRTFALALVYAVLIGLLVLIGFLVGSVAASQASALADKLPGFVQHLKQPADWPIPNWLKPLAERIESAVESSAQQSIPFFQRAGRETLSFLSSAVYALLVPILAFFFLKDGVTMRTSFLAEFEEGPRRELLEDILTDIDRLLAHYVRALVLLGLATFSAYALVFTIFGVPFALLLATMAGLLEFIPLVGPLAAATTVLMVGWFNGYDHLLVILLFMLIYRVFQDYILSPHLMGAGAELHPLVVIFGVLAGDQIGGVPGIFLSIPILATLRIIFVRYQKARLVRSSTIE